MNIFFLIVLMFQHKTVTLPIVYIEGECNLSDWKRNNVLKIGIDNGEIIMNYFVLNCYFSEQKDKIENHCYF